jgi:hypothetical protein
MIDMVDDRDKGLFLDLFVYKSTSIPELFRSLVNDSYAVQGCSHITLTAAFGGLVYKGDLHSYH